MAAHVEPYATSSAGLDIVVMPNVFSPAYFTDSEWFATEIAAIVGRGRLLDIGTGTGVVALLAHLQGASAFASLEDRHRPGRLRENNRAENSHLPIRRQERKMQGFKSMPSAQRFLTTHAAIYNAFDFQRHMISRPTLRIFRARASCVWARAVA